MRTFCSRRRRKKRQEADVHSEQHGNLHQLFVAGGGRLPSFTVWTFCKHRWIAGCTCEKSSKESLEVHRETHTKQKAAKPAWAEGGVSIRIHWWVGAVQRNKTAIQKPVLQLAEWRAHNPETMQTCEESGKVFKCKTWGTIVIFISKRMSACWWMFLRTSEASAWNSTGWIWRITTHCRACLGMWCWKRQGHASVHRKKEPGAGSWWWASGTQKSTISMWKISTPPNQTITPKILTRTTFTGGHEQTTPQRQIRMEEGDAHRRANPCHKGTR